MNFIDHHEAQVVEEVTQQAVPAQAQRLERFRRNLQHTLSLLHGSVLGAGTDIPVPGPHRDMGRFEQPLQPVELVTTPRPEGRGFSGDDMRYPATVLA